MELPLPVPDLPLWDPDALQRVVGDKRATQTRLLEKYLQSTQEIVTALGDAADTSQWTAMVELAHKLKSSSRAVGAMRLGGLCDALEHAGRAAHSSECLALATQVAQGFAEVRACIQARPQSGLS
jgi:HPt (histidine-containing phosphotransfer) domain-containing protein